MMPSRPARIALAVLATLAACCHVLSDTVSSLDAQLAREPAELVTSTGRVYRGFLDGVRDGRLHLRRAADGGEVGYSFAPEEIGRLTLPGRDLEADALDLLDRGDAPSALPLLEALARHRMRYLSVLDEAGRRVLRELVRHGGVAGDPGTVAATIRALRSMGPGPEDELALTACELELALRQDTPAECRVLAARWCTLADPSGPSALGWRVLAQLAYDDSDYEQARWLALHPITFGGHVLARDLDLCYALAIASADRLGDVAHARMLAEEMRQRGLAWPPATGLAGLAGHYASASGTPSLPFFPAQPMGPDLPAAPGSQNLASVCKLTACPNPVTSP